MLQTETLRKVPEHLLKDAGQQTGSGITQTITAGLEKHLGLKVLPDA